MRYASFAARSLAWRLPPPEDQPRLLRAILRELLEERVRSSRGRVVPRGVKRKMSSYPLRPRRYRRRPPLDYTPHIVK